MTTDVALASVQPNEQAIAQYLGLNMKDARTHAVLAVCQRYALDPVLKHVIVIPKGGVYITRDGLLHVAHRSGQLDGIVLEDQGYDTDAGEWWAVVSVYRKDMSHPFRYRGRYPATGSNRAYPQEMAIKCAEAMALRRAFDVTALPILEEHHTDAPAVVDTARLRGRTPTPPVVQQVWPDDEPVVGDAVDEVEADEEPALAGEPSGAGRS